MVPHLYLLGLEKAPKIDLISFTKNFKIKFIGIKSLDLLKMSATEEKHDKKPVKESKSKKAVHFPSIS
jgi:hypothetical protein